MDDTMKSYSPTSSRRSGLLKHRLQLVKREDCERYEIASIPDPLSFEKGFFIVIRACQLLTQKMDGVILVGLAGPSGAGKTFFTEKLVNFMPGIAAISLDNYNDTSRVIDGNFDDPRLTDYDTLLENLRDLKSGKATQMPIYSFKMSCRVGYRILEVPSSRIVVIEGIYALSEKLRPFLDLRVAVRGGVHFDLVKRVLRDINRNEQEPEDIIHQISETVYPMYKAFIEPDLETAHIKIINKFNPFSGFQSPTYILKSARTVTEEQIRAVLSSDCVEATEEIYDIYLLPPGEDPESCQSYLRMRNRDGRYSLMFEEWVTDNPFIISPRITFGASVRLLGGLMALGYTIATILKRISRVFSDEKLCIKADKLEQLHRNYVQVQGKDRASVAEAGMKLGLEGSYIPHSYIEEIQLEKITSEVMALPVVDLKTKLSIDEDFVTSPRQVNVGMLDKKDRGRSVYNKSLSWTRGASKDLSVSLPMPQNGLQQGQCNLAKQYPSWIDANGKRFDDRGPDSPASYVGDQGHTRLLEQLSGLNERLDELVSRLLGLENKLSTVANSSTLPRPNSSSQLGLSSSASVPGNGHANGLGNTATLPLGVATMPNAELLLMEELKVLGRGQRHLATQLDLLCGFLRENLSPPKQEKRNERGNWGMLLKSMRTTDSGLALAAALLVLGFGCIGGLMATRRR
eukprot:c27558_g1_i1 orf=338-2395(-)